MHWGIGSGYGFVDGRTKVIDSRGSSSEGETTVLHLNRTFISLVGAVAIAMGLSAPTRAQEVPTTTAALEVTLAGGVLSFTIDITTELPLSRYSHAEGYTAANGGAFDVVVKDDRNSAAGYVINLAASGFVRDGGGATIDLGVNDTTLAVGAATSVTLTAGNSPVPVALGVTSLTGAARPILTAGPNIGNGHYTAAGYSLSLSGVPAATPPGDYISVLTVSSTAGPQA